MDRVLENLYIGDMNDAARWEENGIQAVANLTQYSIGLERAGVFYLQVNQDNDQPIERRSLEKFIRWMEDMDMKGKKVLVHCWSGMSRAVAFTAAWLMHNGMSWDNALTHIQSCRPIADPSKVLATSVQKFFAERA